MRVHLTVAAKYTREPYMRKELGEVLKIFDTILAPALSKALKHARIVEDNNRVHKSTKFGGADITLTVTSNLHQTGVGRITFWYDVDKRIVLQSPDIHDLAKDGLAFAKKVVKKLPQLSK